MNGCAVWLLRARWLVSGGAVCRSEAECVRGGRQLRWSDTASQAGWRLRLGFRR
jgi:hypothetical protein